MDEFRAFVYVVCTGIVVFGAVLGLHVYRSTGDQSTKIECLEKVIEMKDKCSK